MKKISILLITAILLFSCSDDDSTNSTNCTDAQVETADAATNYLAANPTDSNYTDLCNTYKDALNIQIAACGDDNGALQAIINGLGDCSASSNNGSGSTNNEALMTANLNGVQFDYMVPNGYPMFVNKAISVFEDNYGNNYIRIQGNSVPGVSVDNSYEINIRLREDDWVVGTHDIMDSTYEGSSVDYIDLTSVGSNAVYQAEDVVGSGTITITTFDLTNRIVEGTFQFPYEHVYVSDGSIAGPFNCVNGTFRYALDDAHFD